MSDMICLGVIVGAHGIKGLVRVKSFTEKEADVVKYGPLCDERGNQFDIELVGRSKGVLLAKIEGLTDRTNAEELKGAQLFVHRRMLPAADQNEFYYTDLIGLEVRRRNGDKVGNVLAVHNFGAGDLLDISIEGRKESALVPFNQKTVPTIDLNAQVIIIEPAPGLLEDDEEN